MNPKRPTPTYIIVKMPKVKNKKGISKAEKEKLITHKETPIRLSEYSTEALAGQREYHDIFKVLGKKTPNHEYSTCQNYHSELKET